MASFKDGFTGKTCSAKLSQPLDFHYDEHGISNPFNYPNLNHDFGLAASDGDTAIYNVVDHPSQIYYFSVPASSSSSLATQSGNGPGQPDGSRQQKSQEQGMNSSTKLGIAMGTIAGVALLCVAIFCAYKWKRRSRAVAYEDQYRNGFEDGRRSRQMPDTTSYIMGDGRYTGYDSHASIAPTAYITGVDDYIDEKNAAAYGHYSVGSSGSPPLPVIPSSGDINSFGQRPYSFLNRPPSISTGTETTSEQVQNGELLSLYARSSRGLSWFLPQRNHKPESTLYGNQQAYAGVDISNPVLGPLESVQQPASAHVEFPSRAARMSTTVTEKTSETVTTESTWNTWGVDQRKTLKGNGVVARWLEKSGFK
ncbi:hypothetical protein GQ53DRAFT_811326 [Thozetella sp. PMI_491]|nr:hypothetical protein GQ53DRAFT_811326 [Thozetella sp. PMI_491]